MAPSDPQPIPLKQTLSSLPPIYKDKDGLNLRTEIKSRLTSSTSTTKKIPLLVILDDDPTGTQTCHDISVLTVWDIATLSSTFTSDTTRKAGGFFILTNSRALHPDECRTLVEEVCQNLLQAAKKQGDLQFEVVLRSDSTLRGHFPLEPEAAEDVLGKANAWILAPFFLQGGRYTVGDVHYVEDGKGTLVPAGLTPFAKDATFGYTSSNLREWVVEKSGGRIGLDRVVSLSLEDIRVGGPTKVAELLMGFEKGVVVVVNAAAEEDMDVVVLGILEAASKGRRFLYRSGAALVSSRLGIKPIAPKSADALSLDKSVGGLVVAGSYVPKTTAQLKVLREKSGGRLTTIVVQVGELLRSEDAAKKVIDEAVREAEKEIQRGQDVLIMTSRDLITGKDERESLDIGSVVARSLVRFLQDLKTRPRYVIAKGGITSSDMATKGLKMKCATVVGQAAPGVPLWECFEETSKWAGIPYIVFPGNVGSDDTLFQVVDGWRA